MGLSVNAAADLVLQTLWFVVLGRVLISWVDTAGSGRVARLLIDLSEPILGPVRRVLPTTGGLDWSPLLVMLALQFLRGLL